MGTNGNEKKYINVDKERKKMQPKSKKHKIKGSREHEE